MISHLTSGQNVKPKTYFTAGPSQVYPTVPQHLHRAVEQGIVSISHRGAQFMDIYAQMENGLRAVMGIPGDYHLFLFSSATEIWERIAQNCVEQESFHLVNGNFSQSFATSVKLCGKHVVTHRVGDFEGFPMDEIHVPDTAELIAAIANESSTGVMTPPEDIYSLRKRYPGKLLVIDAVSAVPTWRIDVAQVDGIYFSVQKGFGLPAGLGVLVLSPRMLDRALELERKGQFVGTYHRFSKLMEMSQKHQTPETPNVLAIYLLAQVCADMVAVQDRLMATHEEKYRLLCDFVAQQPQLDFAVKEERVRSNTVVVLDTLYPDASTKLKQLEEKGYMVGSGYGKNADRQVRVANFPGTSVEEMKGLIETMGQESDGTL